MVVTPLAKRDPLEGATAVAQKLPALQTDPQVAIGIGRQAEHRARRKAVGIRLIEKMEIETVEAHQSVLGADPQISIGSLRQRIHGAAGIAAILGPLVANVLPGEPVRIEGQARGAHPERRLAMALPLLA